MRAALIGGGIGGLAAAVGLRRAGVEVVLYERAPSVGTGGVALSLFGNGVRALDALGLGEAVRALGPATPFDLPTGVRDATGRWLTRMGPEVLASTLVVERAALHRLLVEPVRDVIRCASEVVSVADGLVRLGDGREDGGHDVVVAADGLRSRTRRAWPGDPGVRFVGYHAWRGLTADPVAVAGVGELWGSGRRFGLAPLADGRLYWFATANGRAGTPPAATPGAVRDAFADFHDDVRTVLDHTDPATVSALPIEELAGDLPGFVKGSAALLGDAAHAMTPNLGQGANQALEDAAELVHLLMPLARDDRPAPDEVEAALRRYDRRRRPRSQRIARQARSLGRAGQVGNRAVLRLRDVTMRVAPDRLVDASTLQVQRWRVGG